jgi:muramoyltetrapeptide carboxypeptidase
MGVTTPGPAVAAVRPPLLRSGDRAAVLSLSGPLAAHCPRRLARGVAELNRRGLAAEAGAGCARNTGGRAGTAAERAAEFATAVADPEIRAVFSAIGGEGTREILPLLDPAELAGSPTAVIGYSDTASLLLWLRLRLGWVTYYGPAVMPQFGEAGGVDDCVWDAFRAVACAPGAAAGPGYELPSFARITDEVLRWDSEDDRPRRTVPAPGRQTWRAGRASGPLLAANLATLAADLRADALPLTPWRGQTVFLEESDGVSWKEFTGAVAVVEESGLLDGCAALVLGRFAQVHSGRWPNAEVRAALEPLTGRTSGPVVADAEFGHTDPQFTLPLGVPAEVTATGSPDAPPRLRLLPGPAPTPGEAG